MGAEETGANQPLYTDVTNSIREFSDESSAPHLTVDQTHDLLAKTRPLIDNLHASLRWSYKGSDIAILDLKYPDRVSYFTQVNEATVKLAESLPISELWLDEEKEYISALFSLAGEYYHKPSGGYHNFGWPKTYFEIPEERTLLLRTAEEPDLILTPEQELKVFACEEAEFKVHLNTSSSKTRLAAMQAFLQTLKADNDIVTQIFAEKKERGETASVSKDEIRARGGKLASLGQWKMKLLRFSGGPSADFVFYVSPTKNQTPIQALSSLVMDLDAVMQAGEVSLDGSLLPRYSTEITVSGEPRPGFSVCQGNGNFKDYLLRSGGEDKLAKFYDATHNFAFRTGQALINFPPDQ